MREGLWGDTASRNQGLRATSVDDHSATYYRRKRATLQLIQAATEGHPPSAEVSTAGSASWHHGVNGARRRGACDGSLLPDNGRMPTDLSGELRAGCDTELNDCDAIQTRGKVVEHARQRNNDANMSAWSSEENDPGAAPLERLLGLLVTLMGAGLRSGEGLLSTSARGSLPSPTTTTAALPRTPP